MPRKPTPKILNEVEVPPVEETPAVAAENVMEPVTETTPPGEIMENLASAEKVEETLVTPEAEAVAVEAPTPEEGAQPEMTASVPAPSPLYKPMRTLLLASLGAISYAVEEAEFIIRKLVERGELTQKEGSKLMDTLTKRFKKSPKPAEASAEAKESEEMESSEAPAETTGEDAGETEDEDDEEKSKYTPKNIVTFNILSFGSPVMIDPHKKPKK